MMTPAKCYVRQHQITKVPVPAKTDQWLRKADKDAYDKWGAGCEKAQAEIALHATAEVMHIVQVLEDPAVIWENFRMSLGSKGWTSSLHYVDNYSMQRRRAHS